MAGLDPILFNGPRKEPGGEKRRHCKIFMDKCWSDTKPREEKGLSLSRVSDAEPRVE